MRWMASGVSSAGAISTSTNLFGVGAITGNSVKARWNVVKVIFGVEQASSYLQGQLEVGVYAITQSNASTGSVSVTPTPLPQDSMQATWPPNGLTGAATNGVATAWSTPISVIPPNPLIRRAFPVLCESQWTFRDGQLSFWNTATTDTAMLLFRTIGSGSGLVSGLSVSWTVFFEVSETSYG